MNSKRMAGNQNAADTSAVRLWNYLRIDDQLRKADFIVVMGSNDVRCAQRGASLFAEGVSPMVIFTGGFGRITSKTWSEPEAVKFAREAVRRGLPRQRILIERSSKSTNENVECTRALIREKGLVAHRIIAIQKPYLQRRSLATFGKIWPELEVLMTSPQLSFEEFPNEVISKDALLNALVGELQRIRLYAERGCITPQKIPEGVWGAYLELLRLGYNEQLVEP